MKVETVRWEGSENNWMDAPTGAFSKAQLVLVFGSPSVMKDEGFLTALNAAYPDSKIAGCSTAGEIYDIEVEEGTASVTAISFKKTGVARKIIPVENASNSHDAGRALAEALPKEGLRHVFVLSDGLGVNGTDLVKGLVSKLPEGVSITGGLAGDGSRFEKTFVLTEEGVQQGVICGIGLYGDALEVGFGSKGGWDSFGPERLVTRAEGNALLELDHKGALGLYKKYLGEHAEGLPATGLLFPLSIRTGKDAVPLVRTILAIEGEKMIFAGDIPEGSYARLMRANFDRLVDGAAGAAELAMAGNAANTTPDLAILISCVGRRLVLGQRIEEEVEAVRDVLGDKTKITGFYSYGELAPSSQDGVCDLHPQTMTITTFREAC